MSDIEEYGELDVIKKYINNNDVVFDIGANIGKWSICVLQEKSNIDLHLFEPTPKIYQLLNDTFPFTENIHLNNEAVSDNINNAIPFYNYSDNSGLSTFHRRFSVEKSPTIKQPKVIQVKITTIDHYCLLNGISKINFIKIDTEGNEYNVIKGANFMLKDNKIDFMQFEYGGTYIDANITLQQICLYMSIHNYTLYKIEKDHIKLIERFDKDLENFVYSNFLFINNNILVKGFHETTI